MSPGSKAPRPLREDLVLQACLEAYGAIRHEGRKADRALDFTLRRKRNLYSPERRAVSERVYALIRRERLVDHLLGATRPGFGSMPRTHADALRLAASQILTGEKSAGHFRTLLPEPEDLIALEGLTKHPVQSFALRASLPDFFAKKLLEEFGPEAEALAQALNARAPLTVRVNTLKSSREALARALKSEGLVARPTELSPLGLILEERINAFSTEAFKAGLFEVQDEGSQLVGLLVDAPPTLIVDACAGTGGKTLQLAAQMKNRGELYALDINQKRLTELRLRARRAGVFNVRSRLIPAEGPEDSLKDLVSKAHRVLVDAPCTGSGALRRKPGDRTGLSPESLAMHVERQTRLLRQFSALVRPGGQLIYGTCSVLRDENEVVVSDFLQKYPGWRLYPASSRVDRRATDGDFLRVLPNRHGTDGFFGAILERTKA